MPSDPLQDLSSATVGALFEAAASTNPTPGGGAISAINGYLGISLLLKAIRISARKVPLEQAYGTSEVQLLALAPRLLQLAQSDSDAFGLYIKAIQLPKATSAEKDTRSLSIRAANVVATEVALDILDLGNAVLQCVDQVQDKIIPTILADVRACLEFASAMSTVARENAIANLAGMAKHDALHRRLSEAVARHTNLLAACRRA